LQAVALRPATIVSDVAAIAEDVTILGIRFPLRCHGRALVSTDRSRVVICAIDADVVHVMTYYTLVSTDVVPIHGDVPGVPMNVPPVVTNVANVGAPITVSATPGSVRGCQSDDLRASRNGGNGKGRSRCRRNKSVPHVNPPSRNVKAPLHARSGE
jgi:hypothetical protein